jgi:hypothetical protein
VKNDSVQSSASSGGGGGGQYQKVYGNVDKEEMINIASCDFETFKDYMSGKFGQAQFQVGFEVIKSNQGLIFEDSGEEKLMDMIGG